MKISHECPISLLTESRSFNDYDYALVHLFEEIKEYKEFFIESLNSGRKVILDNSIFELGKAFDMFSFANWIEEIRPTEYIIPDVLEDCGETIVNAIKWKRLFNNLPGKKIGVVQGKNYDQLVYCYKQLDEDIGVDKMALSFDYSYYQKVFPHPNKWLSYAKGRIMTINRLLEENVINVNKPHHLLGCSLPFEFITYRTGYPWLESMDTSNPIVHGIKKIRYGYGGLISKESIKLVDLINEVPNEEQLTIIRHNVSAFREIVNG